MVWFKVDDGLMTSPKVLSIPRRDRLIAVGLWCAAGAWSAGKLRDGFVPAFLITELGSTPRIVKALVDSGLWHEVDGGYLFHDWEDWQPTREDVQNKRKKNAEKLRNWRERNRVTDEGVTGLRNGSNQVSNPAPDPTRPDPTYKEEEPPSEAASGPDRDEDPAPQVRELCEHLADRVEENGHKVTRPLGKTWFRSCRLLIEVDGRTPEQVRSAIDWSTADPFWSTNIRSMQSLREKYSTLQGRAKMQNQTSRQNTPGGINWDTASARAAARTAELEGRESA